VFTHIGKLSRRAWRSYQESHSCRSVPHGHCEVKSGNFFITESPGTIDVANSITSSPSRCPVMWLCLPSGIVGNATGGYPPFPCHYNLCPFVPHRRRITLLSPRSKQSKLRFCLEFVFFSSKYFWRKHFQAPFKAPARLPLTLDDMVPPLGGRRSVLIELSTVPFYVSFS
jgi:hypothetical protein